MARQEYSKLDKARAQIVLDHPFLASILLRHPLIPRKDIKTAGIDNRGQIYYNPEWFETLTVPQIVRVLGHECFHRIGQHSQRRGNREKMPWNQAGDAWINDTMEAAQMGQAIDGMFTMPGAKDDTLENLYAKIMAQPPQKGKGKGKGGGGSGKDKGEGEPNGDPLGDDLMDEGEQMTESEIKAQEAEIKLEVAEAAQVAKMRGKLPAALQEFANKIIEVKTPWYDILERFMTEMTKVDFTWTRPNRRYIGGGVYLPSMGALAAMGELVVQVDVSGSVSEREMNYYEGHLQRIIQQCNPAKTHIIYTDTRVVHHDVFEQGQEMSLTFRTGGGTHMPAGYDYIQEQGIEPAVFITLTDGYTAFPPDPQWPSIWCISSDVKAPSEAGETVHFEMDQKF